MRYEYKNGNVQVSFDTSGLGVKTRSWPDGQDPQVDLPESMDLKVTNYCDLGDIVASDGSVIRQSVTCPYCHEKSNSRGKDGNLDLVFHYVSQMHPGSELAIGGGAPLTHSGLDNFLEDCHESGIICNLTNNILHMRRDIEILKEYQRRKLLHGIGVSYRGVNSLRLMPDKKDINYDKVVLHLIIGVHTKRDIEAIQDFYKSMGVTPHILLLGYKTFGNGSRFLNVFVEQQLEWWKGEGIAKMLVEHEGTLAFDNLAIEQTNLKDQVSQDEWVKFFQGPDGTHTMYMDAVTGTFAQRSTSDQRFPLSKAVYPTLQEVFNEVRNHENRILCK